MAANHARHLNRLLDLYTLIQGEPGWNAPKLAERFQTNVRTVFRDVGLLRAAGIPIHHDQERKCFLVRRDFFMPPLALTFGEALALVSCGRKINDGDQIPFTKPALKALAKIRGQLPPAVLRELDLVDDRISVRLTASSSQEAFEDVYETIRRAIATKRRLRCRYEAVHRSTNSKSSGSSVFLFDPYTLMFSQRAWYAVGLHHGHDEIRTLKLNRFADVATTDSGYQIPPNFSLLRHLGNAWRMIRGAQSYKVEIEFDAEFAENITDTVWHPTQEYHYQDDGSLLWKCTVDGLDEIIWWVLGMGGHCRVLKPSQLIKLVRAEVSKLQAVYFQKNQ